MQSLELILILLPSVTLLQCNNYLDYTNDLVQCKQTCPSSSHLKGNKCLGKTHYLQQNSVHLCHQGWVDSSN